MRSLRDWFQHLLGMAGQVAAALPQILMAAFLARRDDLESAGYFAVASGLAAAAFTVATWGLVPHMVLERFRRFPAATYAAARGVALGVIAGATFGAGMLLFPRIGWSIILAVIALRATDSLIELHFGFAQVWSGPAQALRWYAGLHALKLAVIGMLIFASILWPALAPDLVILAGSVTVLALAVVSLLARGRIWKGGEHATEGMSSLFAQSSWFGIAAVLCAIVTNLPRISLPLAYHGEALGVAGISLTIATFFGMTLYTAWVRHFTLLAEHRRRADAMAYLRELAGFTALAAVASLWPLPQLVAWLFDFDLQRHGGEVRGILLAAAVFFAGMSLINLHKLGARPWREAAAYLATAALAVVLGVTIYPRTGLVLPMVAAGALMALLAVPAIRDAWAGAKREPAGA